jgi:hypothetical protein
MSEPKIIVYGAFCVWWDGIEKAGQLPSGIPCCPHCKSVLFQQPEEQWIQAATKHNDRAPGYLAFILWLRGKCYLNWKVARVAYDQELDQKLVANKTWPSQ